MKHYAAKFLGAGFLVAAFLLLIFAPGKENFSVLNIYAFLACFVVGIFLLAGYIGTHPIAAQLRSQAAVAGVRKLSTSLEIAPRTFRAVKKSKKRLAGEIVGITLGLSMIVLGFIINHSLPKDGGLAAIVPWLAGLLFIWCPLRQRSMFFRVDPEGITARQFFSTTQMNWNEIVALVSREHFVMMPTSAHLPVGANIARIYSVYSKRKRVDFYDGMPDAKDLAALIASATGLPWD